MHGFSPFMYAIFGVGSNSIHITYTGTVSLGGCSYEFYVKVLLHTNHTMMVLPLCIVLCCIWECVNSAWHTTSNQWHCYGLLPCGFLCACSNNIFMRMPLYTNHTCMVSPMHGFFSSCSNNLLMRMPVWFIRWVDSPVLVQSIFFWECRFTEITVL